MVLTDLNERVELGGGMCFPRLLSQLVEWVRPFVVLVEREVQEGLPRAEVKVLEGKVSFDLTADHKHRPLRADACCAGQWRLLRRLIALCACVRLKQTHPSATTCKHGQIDVCSERTRTHKASGV